ncbi:MAG: acylphosphatase [Verrucomicrobiota bacterium]|nr:acylphosphatase [Verrucomicrobiota bacterium]
MTSKQVFFSGHVQGVGFRYTVKQIAKGFDVVGWVRNLSDGRVELQATGEDNELAAFLAAIGESELRSHIKERHEHPVEQPAATRGFEIRHD